MTPAHSAGTEIFSSLRQLATRASRSTVSTPLAVASAAAWSASADRMELAGIDFGSGATFMLLCTRRARAVQPDRSDSVGLGRHVAVLREIAESRELALETQFDGAGGAVTLLADDDFGFAVHQR